MAEKALTAVIIAVGVSTDGRREVLGVDIGPSEAETDVLVYISFPPEHWVKLHSTNGRVIAFSLTEGNRHDLPPVQGLVEQIPAATTLLGDTAYDSDRFRTFLSGRGTTPEIKQNPIRKRLHPFDPTAYRRRNVIERAFCLLKDWRRVATRYDKLARTFTATVNVATIVRWWI